MRIPSHECMASIFYTKKHTTASTETANITMNITNDFSFPKNQRNKRKCTWKK